MKILGNILWLIFGGFETAVFYFSGSLALMATIIGIPFGIQTLKIAGLCLFPFGSDIKFNEETSGCLAMIMNLIWIIFGGFIAFLMHCFFGILLCITIIGIPFGMQHFKLARLAISPFGKTIVSK